MNKVSAVIGGQMKRASAVLMTLWLKFDLHLSVGSYSYVCVEWSG